MRANRIETAHALSCAIIDVINDHVRSHGAHDPKLKKVLMAALATVVSEINNKVAKDFGRALASMLD